MGLQRAITVLLAAFVLQSDVVTPTDPLISSILPKILADLPRYQQNSLNYVIQTQQTKDHFAFTGNLTAGQFSFHQLQLLVPSTAFENQISWAEQYQSHILHEVQREYSLSSTQTHDLIVSLDKKILYPTSFKTIKPVYSPYEDPSVCPFPKSSELDCNALDKYRTIDGSCNNLHNPLWGRSDRPFRRFIPADYADGVDAPRTGKFGPLPSAREVSLKVSQGKMSPDPAHSFLFTICGQFLDHDVTLTPLAALTVSDPEGEEDTVHVTCGSDGCNTTGVENKDCLPIPIPNDDTAFSSKNCVMFVRSSSTPADECPVGPRQQTNALTSFIDSSNVYGSTKKKNDELRAGTLPSRGRLFMEDNPLGFRELLQYGIDRECRDVDNFTRCFVAGDIRVNEHMGLTAVHTAFSRYHNDIEKKLYDLNPHWSGEQLFQESRKIVIAVWQRIVYNEFLPLVLGPKQIREKKFDLKLRRRGFFNKYNPKLSPEVANGFSLAYRFGHSTIPDKFQIISPINNTLEEEVFLSEVFNRPTLIYKNYSSGASNIDSILRGMYMMSNQRLDRHLTTQVTNKLFSENPPTMPGLDLFALNIQRARDHGIPGYTAWRKWCGLSVPTSFGKMRGISRANQRIFRRLYDNIHDVDFWPAAIAEKARKGALIGPTLSCIIGQQFSNLRRADRFWHEREDPVTGFTKAQLQEIRKALFSRVLCDISDQVTTIQRFVLLQPNKSVRGYQRRHPNALEPCSGLPQIDFSKWQETP